jgi:hypothetical protein
MTLTFEACERCGDSYCEPCPQCGACSSDVSCSCHPPVSSAIGSEGSCEGCGRPITAGDRIMVWGDEVVTHEQCPEWAQA